MTECLIAKVKHLDTHKLMQLVDESKSEGFFHLERLVTDYGTGTNTFDKNGEALFLVLKNSEIVGVCGLNQDPFSDSKKVGRVRRLYVSPSVNSQNETHFLELS
ncbi:GNAT family N-acetyltransferase [Paenibacillus sp. Sa2BVA9]|uniref:GNAT family N-acetyltransferase n=1 Tax=Paenibacillus gallinarum TaxID=2762232 RepID=A0ABR8T5L4_9BACL|nr:GNAT family N-acetyltransferase [Paenibacillus gallinarum]